MLAAFLLPLLGALDATGIRHRAMEMYRALETPRSKIALDSSSLPDTMRGPEGAVSWKLLRDGGDRPGGTEVLVLRWEDAKGAPLGNRRIAVKLSRREWTPYATGRLERGDRPDSTRLRWEWTEAKSRTPPSPDPRDLPGLRLRTGAGPDQPLRMDLWERVPAVIPGQVLTVVSQRSGARASIEGTAQGSAVEGGTLRVRTAFGRRILCRLLADGTALALD